MRATAPDILANEGVILVPNNKVMEVEETKDTIAVITCPPVKIPIM